MLVKWEKLQAHWKSVKEFRLIFTNRRNVLTSKMQFNKVNESLQVGGTIAQIQNKNKAVREEEKS